jgi:hypothetical protein
MNLGLQMYLFETLLSIILSMHSLVELLDYMTILFLIFWETAILFSTMTVPFYIPTNNAQGLQFLHILSSMLFLLLLIEAILMGV